MKKPRRKIILSILAILIAGAVVAEYFVSRGIANKLVSTLQSRADVELRFDQAWYIPPFGMKLFGVRVIRDAQDIVTVSRLDVRLDSLPRPKQQLVIRSIDIEQPVVRIVRPTSQPSPRKKLPPQQKLSTLFKLTQLRIAGGEIRDERGAEPMVWRNINVDIDTTQQSDAKYTFAIAAQDGAMFDLKSRGDIDVDELLLNLNEFELHARHDVAHPSESLPPLVEKALRANGMSGDVTITFAGKVSKSSWAVNNLRAAGDFKESGRVDLAGAASGPMDLQGKSWWQAIDHDFTAQPHDFSFRPKGFQFWIQKINGDLARFTGGVVQFHNLTARYADDQIELRGARLELKSLPKIAFSEIDSTVTFSGARVQYSPKLTKVIEQIRPVGPFVIGGAYTIIRGQPSQYDLKVSSDTGALNLFDGRIALANVRGDAHLLAGKLETENIAANIFGGDGSISGVYEFGDSQNFHGHLTLRKVDLLQVAKSYGQSDSRLRGRGFLDADFDSVTGAAGLDALHAKGEIAAIDGEFFELPVLRELFGIIKPARKAVTAGEAGALFEIKDRIVQLRRAAINAPILGLQGGGEIGFDGNLHLEVVAAPLADWRENMKKSRIPIISDVAGEIVGGVQRLINVATGTLLYQFRVDETLKQPQIKAVPAPILSDAGALLFGYMLKEKKKDERLVDFLKAQK